MRQYPIIGFAYARYMLVFYGGNLHAMTNNNKVEIEVQHGTNCRFVTYRIHRIFQQDVPKDAKHPTYMYNRTINRI